MHHPNQSMSGLTSTITSGQLTRRGFERMEMAFSFKLFRKANVVDQQTTSTRPSSVKLSTPVVSPPQHFTIQGVGVEVSEEFVPGHATPTPSIIVRVDPAHPSRTRVLKLIGRQVEQSEYSFPFPVTGDASE